MSITNLFIIDVTEFKKKNTKFIFLQNLEALQGGITFFLSRGTTTNFISVFVQKTAVVVIDTKSQSEMALWQCCRLRGCGNVLINQLN